MNRPTQKGLNAMELLRIDNEHKAFFKKRDKWIPIIDIEKEDILELVRDVASTETIEIDECTEEKYIVNPVEKDIYEQLYLAINDLVVNRHAYCEDIDQRFETIKSSASLPNCLSQAEENLEPLDQD